MLHKMTSHSHAAQPLSASAKVVDGTLIMSLPDAVIPTVWRLELGQAKASAIEARSMEDDTNHYKLVLKTPRGDVNEIAEYETKDKAVSAIMIISHAMEHAHGQINPERFSASTASQNRQLPALYKRPTSEPYNRKIGGIAAVVIILGLLIVLFNLGPKSSGLSMSNTAGTAIPSMAGSATGQETPSNMVGVPMSAEDFLKDM